MASVSSLGWLEILVEYAQSQLEDNHIEKLLFRGASSQQIESYRLGVLGSDGLPVGDYPDDFARWAGNHKDKLKDCFVIPLTNTRGSVLGLQFRSVHEEVKGYIDFFASKEVVSLFGLAQAMPHAWETGELCLVEGAFDLFPIQRHLPGTVATLKAGISAGFSRVVSRFVKTLYVAYDADSTGRDKASKIAKGPLKDVLTVKVLDLPKVYRPDGTQAKDPAEIWKLIGDQRFGVYLKQQTFLF